MAGASDKGRDKAALVQAAKLMAEALDILDGFDGPTEAAAHLDLALEMVREEIGRRPSTCSG